MSSNRAPRTSPLDGILAVAKPVGPTSHDVVSLVRRLSGTRRIGHGGTLDPFASGVLPLFLGHATRLVEYHIGDRKTYRATVCFGASSSTDDLEGDLTPAEGAAPDGAAVAAALDAFRGVIRQRPPAFSAVKVGGRRAYAMARAGDAPELPEREVTIHRAEMIDWDSSDPARPVATLEIECSAGTYVRAIARDLGRALDSAAYLGALTRTASGSFALADACSLDQLREAAADGPDGLRPLLRPLDHGLGWMPALTLEADEVEALSRGQFVRPRSEPALGAASAVRVYAGDGAMIAIGAWSHGRLAPTKVLRPLPEQPADERSADEPAEARA